LCLGPQNFIYVRGSRSPLVNWRLLNEFSLLIRLNRCDVTCSKRRSSVAFRCPHNSFGAHLLLLKERSRDSVEHIVIDSYVFNPSAKGTSALRLSVNELRSEGLILNNRANLSKV